MRETGIHHQTPAIMFTTVNYFPFHVYSWTNQNIQSFQPRSLLWSILFSSCLQNMLKPLQYLSLVLCLPNTWLQWLSVIQISARNKTRTSIKLLDTHMTCRLQVFNESIQFVLKSPGNIIVFLSNIRVYANEQ